MHETVAEIRHHNQHDIKSHFHPRLSQIAQERRMSTMLNKTHDIVPRALDSSSHHGSHADQMHFLKTNSSKLLRMKQLGCISTVSFTTNIAVGIQDAQDKISPYLVKLFVFFLKIV